MNTAHVKFTEQDLSFSVAGIPEGISGIQIVTKRGKPGLTSRLITSWPEFQKYYGGLMATNEGPLQAKILLEGGSQLRVNSVRHYTDPANASTMDAVYAAVNGTDGGVRTVITGAFSTGNTYQMAATGMTTVSQVYVTSALQTMKELLAKFYAANKTKILAYGVISATTFYMAPAFGSTLAGIAITGTGVTATTNTQLDGFENAAAGTLFLVAPKGPGAEYNKLAVSILPASNGNAAYFNMQVWIQGEDQFVENYENLTIPAAVNVGDQKWADDINASSYLIDITYVNLTGVTDLNPVVGIRTFSDGTDGSALVDADFIGDSSGKTGWYAFDAVDDIVSLGAPSESADAVHQAGAAYANTRQDLVYFAHLSNSLKSEAALVAKRESLLIDNSYTGFYAGGLKVIDPLTSKVREISELGAVMALAAASGVNHGMEKSFAGPQRGIILNTQGPVNNFGAAGNFNGMNLLANRQINVVIARDGKVMLWGNFTSQIATSLLSFINVRRLLIYIKKSLRPVIERYLEEPNIMDTWKMIYNEVTPFLDGLYARKAFFPTKAMPKGYRWEGDQFAKDLDSLVVNAKDQVLQGKYKVRLFCTPTPSMQEVEIQVTVMGSNISFEEVLGS